MEGLKNFIEVDNHSALNVGHLEEGTRSFEVRRPKVRRGVPQGVNQGRSRAIDAQNRRSWLTQKACISVDHFAEDRWGPPLVDADWHAFCQAMKKRCRKQRLCGIVRALQRNE